MQTFTNKPFDADLYDVIARMAQAAADSLRFGNEGGYADIMESARQNYLAGRWDFDEWAHYRSLVYAAVEA